MGNRSMDQTSIKVPTGILESIDRDIDQTHDFRNRSEWIIAAMREFIKIRTKEIKERKEAFGIEPHPPKGGGGSEL